MRLLVFLSFLSATCSAQNNTTTALPTTGTSNITAATALPTTQTSNTTATTASITVSTVTTRTTTASCQDNPSANCAALKAYCSNPAYRDLLTKNCPVTCNFCGASDCYDVSNNCADWSKNGFCTSPFYKDEAEKYCKKTCGLC